MAVPGFDSWLLCATPRSGSTLLCGLLESSGVAGRPASYFDRRGLHDYATAWRIAQPARGRIDAAYVRAAVAAGSTPNGVFGGRLMAESRPELVADLAAEADQPPASELDLLVEAFGRLRFVHLRRLDVVAQAVSWAKSLQTHYWHPGEVVGPGAVAPYYDEELIGRLVDTVEQLEAGWARWFTEQRISPLELTYEQLAEHPLRVARQVLDFLGLEVEEGREVVIRDRRQADQVNARWIETFRSR